METIYEIIESVAIYLILVTVIMNLIGDSSYKKYVELVCGMILIVILLNPITKFLSLDETFFYNWNLSNYKIESMDKSKLYIAQKKQERKMEQQYTDLLKDQIKVLVESEGRYLTNVNIRYKKNTSGVIKKLLVWVSPEKKELKQTKQEKEIIVKPEIEPVKILQDETEENESIIVEKGQLEKRQIEKKQIEENQKEQEETQIEKNIKLSLMKTYQLKEKQVKVYES